MCDRVPMLPALVQVASALQRADVRLADLSHVASIISSYIDTSVFLTPFQAATKGSYVLFDRVVTRVTRDPAVDPAFRSHWLARSLETAIQKNDLKLVQLIHHWHPAPLNALSLRIALEYGSVELVQWVVQNRNDRRCCEPGLEKLCRACLIAALPMSYNGPDPERVLEWLVDAGVDVAQLQGAVHNLTTLKWLDAQGYLDSFDLSSQLKRMISNGDRDDLDTLRYLINRGVTLPQERLIASLVQGSCRYEVEPVIDAVVSSQLCDSIRDKFTWASTRPEGPKVLQWDAAFMAEMTIPGAESMTHAISMYAAQYSHVDMVAWLMHERSARPRHPIYPKPSREEDFLALHQWKRENGVRDEHNWQSGDTWAAARRGYLRSLEWAQQNIGYVRLCPRTMNIAAEAGHLSIVQWLHTLHPNIYMVEALAKAAKYGHLDVVQWLSTHQTQGNTNDAMVAAAIGAQLEVLVWLHANRVDSCNACVLSAVLCRDDCVEYGLDAIRWLTARASRASSCVGGCIQGQTDSTSVAAVALEKGDVAFAQYLLEHHRQSFTMERVERVIHGGHVPALEWLHSTAPEMVDWPRALQVARDAGKIDIVAWLEAVHRNAEE